ncbi:hypothetical protein DFH11DRAFT_553244 [Phellopilus nigrolimitatus]|nr:hypothetical protein DFH11DRAFT_553244 [Phellopilus nigrolimitatus]
MFFTKIAASLSLAVSLVSALSIQTPTNWTSGGPATISWTAVNGDTQTFSIELANTIFHNSFALANNVQTGALTLNLELPIVPVGDGYTLEFVNIGNISDIFTQTGDFSIGATVSSSAASSSTASGSASASGSVSGTSTVPANSASSSGFGTTNTVASGTNSVTGTASSSGSSASSSAFSSAAVALGVSHANLAGYAVMAAAALAGARLVGF